MTDNTINKSQSINFLLTVQRCCYLNKLTCIKFLIKRHIRNRLQSFIVYKYVISIAAKCSCPVQFIFTFNLRKINCKPPKLFRYGIH